MALTDLRQTSIQIVNRVQRKLGVNATASLASTKHSIVLTDLLNEVVSDLSDAGEWQEMIREVNVTAATSTITYSVETSAVVHHISEIAFDTDVSPLSVVDVEEIRRLNRLSGTGRPRHFSPFGTDSVGNPQIRVHPQPGSNENGKLLKILYYQKPRLYTTSDDSISIPFPADVVFQGLYAKALLEENGGEQTRQYQTAYAEYERMKQEAINRFTTDTGTDMNIVPMGGRG
ncbi:MAG: hypothetical protein C4523_02530 [Myxococcales bacterium]|jgi:hypothetical protein|nr:MAG: hypothetical protein C4523_02530 [Myxococcales bacterium]